MATMDEVLAFRQNCATSVPLDDREVARGLDAARNVSTHIHNVTESFDASYWRSMSDDFRDYIKKRLKQGLMDEVIGQGRIPVELPSVQIVDVQNGWGLTHVKATVRSRIA